MKVQVYSQTTVHDAEGNYQLAIVEFESGERRTIRVPGARIEIGDWLDWNPAVRHCDAPSQTGPPDDETAI